MYRSRVSYETKLERDEGGTKKQKKGREPRDRNEGRKRERERMKATGGRESQGRPAERGQGRRKSEKTGRNLVHRTHDESANTHRPGAAYPAGSPTRSRPTDIFIIRRRSHIGHTPTTASCPTPARRRHRTTFTQVGISCKAFIFCLLI